jgi:hypothetical protein
MGFIESLNKYSKKIPLNKTILYKKIEANRKDLEANGFKFKIRDEFDMFDLEIFINGLDNKKKIDDAYKIFMSQNYDVLEYLNYEEKRKMFNLDIADLLKSLTSFYDSKSETEIYIPFLEPFVNKWYSDDYGVLMLKQHNEYVSQYKLHSHSAPELYGNGIYSTYFSSLKIVYEDDRHICYYYDELYTIYIFKKDTLEFLNQVCFIDNKCKTTVSDKDVSIIINYIESYQYNLCLDYLYEHGFISQKVYKKILKQYK